jgi:membrane-associated phospholipid phosphatase
MKALGASVLLLLLALPVTAAPQVPEVPSSQAPDLTVDLTTAAIVTGGELVLTATGMALKGRLVPDDCRWCDSPQLDLWARQQLKWTDTRPAENGSNALQVILPVGAVATLWIWAAPHGNRQVAEDLLVVTEAATTTMFLTVVSKVATVRQRPFASAVSDPNPPYNIMSFWSGHTSFTFAVAAASTQVARLRGRSGWKWLAVATFAGAALTGYLRIAADQHWLTDVVMGAAVGTAVGLALPVLVMRPAEGKRPAVTLAPAPGGLALYF